MLFHRWKTAEPVVERVTEARRMIWRIYCNDTHAFCGQINRTIAVFNLKSGELFRELAPPEGEITHLILISDLRMLYPMWRIFYQLGESHLNVFWHHILENLLSVDIFYQIGIMFYQMFTISEGSIFY